MGATMTAEGGTGFSLFAPLAEKVVVSVFPDFHAEMSKSRAGFWTFATDENFSGLEYRFSVDGQSIPDPASRFQPKGTRGPSMVVDPAAYAVPEGPGIALEDMVIYELHTGCFTSEGILSSAGSRLDHLKELGVNAVEIMPVAQFSGTRNWGYDGVFPFAVQNSYGGPKALAELVTACHERDMAVIMDVVYNHLGPEGNFLHQLGVYFTGRYKTPWGEAVNFDGPYSHGVREFFIQNSLYWLFDLNIDGLRLDAVSAIHDSSSVHILEEISARVREQEDSTCPRKVLIAECGQNNARNVRGADFGGYGLDSMWSFDFHHSLHAAMTGEELGYYLDYAGDPLVMLAKTLDQGFAFQGQYSEYYKHYRGSRSVDLPATCFVGYSQSHDEVGNRGKGERLISLVGTEKARLAAALVIFAAHIPMLFMGEEFGEDNPFYFFHDFSDQRLVNAVSRGRRRELREFGFDSYPPVPHKPEAFERSKLDWSKPGRSGYRDMLEHYKKLIALRQALPALKNPDKSVGWCFCPEKSLLAAFRPGPGKNPGALCLYNFSSASYLFQSLDHPENGFWNLEWEPGPDQTRAGRDKFRLGPWKALVLSRPGNISEQDLSGIFNIVSSEQGDPNECDR